MNEKRTKNKIVKKRHNINFAIVRFFFRPFAFLKYGFRTKKKKLKKNENYFILMNHQTLLDPFFVSLSFNKAIYFVTSEHLFNQKILSPLFKHFFSPIKKMKAVADPLCLKNCMIVAREKGNVGLFVEGNRAWADFQFYIDPSIARLVKAMKIPLMIYNLKGGYGVDPRWSNKPRRGKFTGEIKSILSVDEIKEMSDKELYEYIINNLRVIDSESNNLYKSRKKAEFLERELFICPCCNKVSTLNSKGNFISCNSCGLKVEYKENLTLYSENKSFKFNKLVEWYDYQIEEIKKMTFKDEDVIFNDENVAIYKYFHNEPRKLIAKGKMILKSSYIQIGDFVLDLNDLIAASPVGGYKLSISTTNDSYFIIGDKRFNTIKYTLIFNVLDTKIKQRGGDNYYGLDLHN